MEAKALERDRRVCIGQLWLGVCTHLHSMCGMSKGLLDRRDTRPRLLARTPTTCTVTPLTFCSTPQHTHRSHMSPQQIDFEAEMEALRACVHVGMETVVTSASKLRVHGP